MGDTERLISHVSYAGQCHSDAAIKFVRRRTGDPYYNAKMQRHHATLRDDAFCLIADIKTGFVKHPDPTRLAELLVEGLWERCAVWVSHEDMAAAVAYALDAKDIER